MKKDFVEKQTEIKKDQDFKNEMKVRYIVVHSRMYEIFEDEPSVKVCRV